MTVKILKCINQEMLSPGVMALRGSIYEKFPFKDIKGGWEVIITISEKEYRVTHIKKEQSYDVRDEARFTFEWIVDIPFKKSDLESFKPVMTLSDYFVNKRFPLAARKELLDLLLPVMNSQEMFKRLIFRRPIANTNIEADYVSFIKKGSITVVDADHVTDIFHKPADDTPESEIKAIRSLFLGIARYLNDPMPLIKSLEETITSVVKGGPGLHEQLRTVVQSIDDSTGLARVLKGASFEAQFPVFVALRAAFSAAFPFKRIRGACKSSSLTSPTYSPSFLH